MHTFAGSWLNGTHYQGITRYTIQYILLSVLSMYDYHVKPMRFCVLCVVVQETLGWYEGSSTAVESITW